MGNMLPACLVHQGATAALPATKPRQRLVSLRLLVKLVHKLKKMGARSNGEQAKIGRKSSSAAADGRKGGGGGKELEEVTSRKVSSNPKQGGSGNVLRSRLRRGGGGGGHKKGVVRVKVVLTKEDAARLLTLTAGGQKTAAQIVAEIKRMELRRAASNNAAWRPALESIPEEMS